MLLLSFSLKALFLLVQLFVMVVFRYVHCMYACMHLFLAFHSMLLPAVNCEQMILGSFYILDQLARTPL